MPSLWKQLLDLIAPPDAPAQNQTAEDAPQQLPTRDSAYPNAYHSLAKDAENDRRAQVFDPALGHFAAAFRIVDPTLTDAEVKNRYDAARMQVIKHLLDSVNASQWRDNLVLRGSLLLTAWLGAAARSPGDIDFVVRPRSINLNDRATAQFFAQLIENITADPNAGDAVIETSKIAVDDIWTYERAPGRRITFPWRVANLPAGSVQIDFVFDEDLPTNVAQVEIPLGASDTVTVWAVDRELSLAWKLMWLETDRYPQGKDLYDAALLAEQTTVSLALLMRLLRECDPDYYAKRELAPDFALEWQIEWDDFKREYPQIEGAAKDWQLRLTKALAPIFTAQNND